MAMFRNPFDKIKKGLEKTRTIFSTGAKSLKSFLSGQKLSTELLTEMERRLIEADIGIRTAIELRKDIQAAWERGEMDTGDEAFEFIRQQLIDYWPDEDRQLRFAESGPTVILVVGINGAGKTTSIAKLAKSLHDQGKSVMLAAGDTFRAAAVEQLEIWSERLGVEVVKGKQGGDPAAVAFDAAEAALARNIDVLIVDTAGRLHTQKHLMDQLGKIRRVIEKKIPGAPHETIMVLDATIGQNAVNQAKIFAETTNVTGLFLAKLDGTAKGGIVVAVRENLGIPVKFVGLGETPDDVAPFDPTRFVDALFAAD